MSGVLEKVKLYRAAAIVPQDCKTFEKGETLKMNVAQPAYIPPQAPWRKP